MITIPVQMPDSTVTPVRVFEGADGAPAIVVWPGFGLSASYYDPFASALTEHGVNVVVAELRGQGASEPSPSRESSFGYQEMLTVDFPAVLEVAREQFPASTPYLLGHSVGGQLAVMFAARVGHNLGGLILVAAGSPYFKGFPGARVFGPLVGAQAMSLTANIAGYWPGDKVNFAGFGPQSKTLITDWSRFARTGRMAPTGADIDYEARIAEIDLPVLAISVARDDLAPGQSVKNLVSKLASAKVTSWRNSQPLGHVGWIREPKSTVTRIKSWLDDLA
ncbi:hypothetical protein AS9A_0590 [Hoyosella subflava DQS3-9A1]|uniref:Serine aminopeptidase S33 domain-containing protein n=2 Tax=Hoyosella TaxID=697025 RepID=F6EJJ5_HOYSD|nr:hypothetical protein AS9A_0590 [Hoyosella subflava DQS3-9A1]